jgi:drug/metabolite transporter (DMT)-like permease
MATLHHLLFTAWESFMHISSGRWLYGLWLALLTALLWGILPVKLKQVLQVMDPVTVTWFRLLVSGAVLFIWLASVGRLPSLRQLGRKGRILVALSVLGLLGNYVLYLIGLKLLSPGTAQLIIQVGPILLLIGSIFLFKERFSVAQGFGLLVLLIGFGLFFNQRLEELLTSMSQYTAGVLTVFLAAVVWTFYSLSQKQLLTVWNSIQVMMVIYLLCALLITPWAHPMQALQLSPLQGWLLLACCLNTLVAYGAFAEALAHWEASRVSATLALTPLVTFVSVAIAAWLWPDYVQAEEINALGYGGAILVVVGSAVVALGPSLLAGLRARKARLASQA